MKFIKSFAVVVLCGLLAKSALAEELFSKTVGSVQVGVVTQTSPLQVPFITWGGDIPTFYANGGLDTKSGTIFQKQGLNLHLVPGDDFVQQVRDYVAGKSPFLRGTFSMIGLASEVIGKDERTKGVVIFQLTWSAGDHMVGRRTIKDPTDLKGKKIVLQAGGPHIGFLDDILKTAQLTWDDITVVWADDLTGTPKSPAEMFKKDPTIDACFVITPDMIGLCGGLKSTGTGAEGTIKDARVVISTVDLSRSIADVYVCRKDFYEANKDLVTKFAAGYLKGCEDVVKLRDGYDSKKASGAEKANYLEILKLAQDIYTTNVIKTLEEDGHGLLMDATFVGYPGNWKFFKWGEGNTIGFESFVNKNLELAVSRGYAKVRIPLIAPDFDFTKDTFTRLLRDTARPVAPVIDPAHPPEPIGEAAFGNQSEPILVFNIQFEPNDFEFSERKYGDKFKLVVETAARFSHAAFVVRGHADPTYVLSDLVNAGLRKGVFEVAMDPVSGQKTYTFHGKPFELTSSEAVANAIASGEFDGVEGFDPRTRLAAAEALSQQRAEGVKAAVIKYARDHGLILDARLFKTEGVGVREPIIKKPKDMEDVRKNTRAQFSLVPIQAEVKAQSGTFDY